MKAVVDGQIDWTEEVWRYFRPERFANALATASLYFAPATAFHDAFEGAVAVQIGSADQDPRYTRMDGAEHAFFELKRLTKINSWHRAAYESDAMWKLYAGEHKGIAICSTPERMRAAFKPFRLLPQYGEEDIWAGPVRYVDLTKVRANGVDMLGRFFLKHRAFEWEREFRLAITLRVAEEFGVVVPDEGIFVEANLHDLVERIVLGATMTAEERNTATEQVERAGLADRLQVSTLLGRPRFI